MKEWDNTEKELEVTKKQWNEYKVLEAIEKSKGREESHRFEIINNVESVILKSDRI